MKLRTRLAVAPVDEAYVRARVHDRLFDDGARDVRRGGVELEHDWTWVYARAAPSYGCVYADVHVHSRE